MAFHKQQEQQVQQKQQSEECEMSNVKLEVGQVWRSISGSSKEWTILDIFNVKGNPYIAHKFMNAGVVENVAFCEEYSFIDGVTLITTADGTPYVAPNDYREGDIWEDYKGSEYGNELFCFDIFSDESELKFKSVFHDGDEYAPIDCLLNDENFILIYRGGKVVTND